MIRVLHSVYGMNRGGIETFLMNVYRNIDRTKVQFDFLVHTDKKCNFDDEIAALGGNIFHIPARNEGVLKNRKALDEFFEAHLEYRILHQHASSLSYVEPLKAAKRCKVSTRIIHAHSTQAGGSFLHNYVHRWNRLFLKSYATSCFACSDLAGKWMYGKKQYEAGTFKIINNGIPTNKFVFNEAKRNKVRSDLGVEGKFVLGHVGRFFYPKNHEFLIDIFQAAYEKEPNSVLLLVGEGELREQIEQKIASLNLKRSVILTGIRDDISDLLQAMDIFIFPSHYEGLPVTLVEAQATGLPCLVSDNITKQVKLTNNIEYIDLLCPISKWVDRIFAINANYVRQDESKQIVNAGFDIEKTTQWLQDLYINC